MEFAVLFWFMIFKDVAIFLLPWSVGLFVVSMIAAAVAAMMTGHEELSDLIMVAKFFAWHIGIFYFVAVILYSICLINTVRWG